MTERTIVAGTITWHEASSGVGYLALRLEDGGYEEREWDEPINAATESDPIIHEFSDYDIESVDHDKEFIHVEILR